MGKKRKIYLKLFGIKAMQKVKKQQDEAFVRILFPKNNINHFESP